jgi:hypothetical protein
MLVMTVYLYFGRTKISPLKDVTNVLFKPSITSISFGGCETFIDLGCGSRPYVLSGLSMG